MPAYIEYQLDENTTILVEAPDGAGGIVKASHAAGEVAKVKARKTFTDALKEFGLKPNCF